MDQKQLAYFIAVAKYRKFFPGCPGFLSRPSLRGFSHQIKMLEKELDTELFVRNTKKVTLTDSGELFLEDAKSILDAMGGQIQNKNWIWQKDGLPYYVSAIFPLPPTSFFRR